MKQLSAVAVAVGVALALSGCDKASSVFSPNQQASASAPQAASSPAPAAPKHNYDIVDNGTYGYEPALSEDDIRSGKATKALIMMRYVGNRNGVYTILILGEDPSNTASAVRLSCSAPCSFAKSETLLGDDVIKTETVPVKADSIFGAMLQDAVSGQLTIYGQQPSGNGITMPAAQQQTSIPQPPPLLPPVSSQFTASAVAPDPVSATSAASVAPASATDLTSAPPAAVASSTGAVTASGQTYPTSFDCSKARSLPEYLICHDPDLAASDRELGTLTQQAKASVTDINAFMARANRQWNYREKTCHDKPCLAAWYAYQKDIMTKIAQTGDANAR